MDPSGHGRREFPHETICRKYGKGEKRYQGMGPWIQ